MAAAVVHSLTLAVDHRANELSACRGNEVLLTKLSFTVVEMQPLWSLESHAF